MAWSIEHQYPPAEIADDDTVEMPLPDGEWQVVATFTAAAYGSDQRAHDAAYAEHHEALRATAIGKMRVVER